MHRLATSEDTPKIPILSSAFNKLNVCAHGQQDPFNTCYSRGTHTHIHTECGEDKTGDTQTPTPQEGNGDDVDPTARAILTELRKSKAARRLGLANLAVAEGLLAAAMGSGRVDYVTAGVAQALTEADMLECGAGQLTRPGAVRMLRVFAANARPPRAAPEPVSETLWKKKRAEERQRWKTPQRRSEAQQSTGPKLTPDQGMTRAANVLELLKGVG